MCVIIGKVRNAALPTEDVLDRCAVANRDGVGVAYTSGDGIVHIKKDFVSNTAFKDWMRDNLKIEDAAIIHYRLATSGRKDCGNAHPFPITSEKALLRKTEIDCDVALAHNGVFSGMGGEKYSDTQEFIIKVLSEPGIKDNLHKPGLQELILKYIEPSRLFFLHGDGMIWHYGKIYKDYGLIFSNENYKSYEYASNWQQGRVWSFERNCYVDKDTDEADKKRAEKIKTAREKIERLGTETNQSSSSDTRTSCFLCGLWFIEKKMLEVARKHNKTRVEKLMCRKCFYNEGGKNNFEVYDPKVHIEDVGRFWPISNTQKSHTTCPEVQSGIHYFFYDRQKGIRTCSWCKKEEEIDSKTLGPVEEATKAISEVTDRKPGGEDAAV